jgi:hypothetical protein
MDKAREERGAISREIENTLGWLAGFPRTDWKASRVCRVPGVPDAQGGLYRWDQLMAALVAQARSGD